MGNQVKLLLICMHSILFFCMKIDNEEVSAYQVLGQAAGLKGNVILQNQTNNEEIIVHGNGQTTNFSFKSSLKKNETFSIFVASHPVKQRCSLNNAAGDYQTAKQSFVELTCNDIIINSYKKIFLTAAIFTGNLNANHTIAFADSACMTDTNFPGTGTYKALLADQTRTACTSANCLQGGISEHLDWVLLPETTYLRSNGTTEIFTTNTEGVLNFSIGNTMLNPFDTTVTDFWSGLSSDWTTNNKNCTNLITLAAKDRGSRGSTNSILLQAISNTPAVACTQTLPILCVEQ